MRVTNPPKAPKAPKKCAYSITAHFWTSGHMPNKSRNYVFTLFDYLSEDIDYVCDEIPSRGGIFQEEVAPETGRRHLQGFLRFYKSYTLTQVKAMFGAERDHVHLEQARDPPAAVAYCRKGETRDGEVYEWGDLSYRQGARSDLMDIYKDLEGGMTNISLVRTHFSQYVRYNRGFERAKFWLDKVRTRTRRAVEVIFVTGLTDLRKTGTADVLFNPYILRREKSYDNVWFDGYDGEETLLIDDFYGWMPYEQLLGLLDGVQTKLATKGGNTFAEWTRVVITSNRQPARWYRKAR